MRRPIAASAGLTVTCGQRRSQWSAASGGSSWSKPPLRSLAVRLKPGLAAPLVRPVVAPAALAVVHSFGLHMAFLSAAATSALDEPRRLPARPDTCAVKRVAKGDHEARG